MADYYYLNAENQPVGPMTLEGIRKLVATGIVGSNVLVCPAGEGEWKPISDWEAPVDPPLGPPLTPPPPRASSQPAAESPSPSWTSLPEWTAPAAMWGGLLSILVSFLPVLALLLAIPAVVGGVLVLKRPASSKRGFALAAILTGGLGALPALLIILGMFFGMLTPGGGEVAEMERALRKGIEVGHDAAKRYPDDAASQSRFIASALQKIDTRGCPPEFRVAYQRNIDAWETAAPYFEANNPATWFLEGFFGGLANDFSGVGYTDYQARLAAQNIDATYRDLREIAVAYGARIPTP